MTTALSLAPPSPFLSLLHLRHLLRITAPHATILSFAKFLTTRFGAADSLDSVREEIWVARVETVVGLGSIEEVNMVFEWIFKNLVWSGRIWEVICDYVERAGTEDVGEWYLKSIVRVLGLDGVSPIGLESKFSTVEVRELLPIRYINYLITSQPTQMGNKLITLLTLAPTLPLSIPIHLLSIQIPDFTQTELTSFRSSIHNKIIAHPQATPIHFIAFATHLLQVNQIQEANRIIHNATKKFTTPLEAQTLQLLWAQALDA